MCLRLERTGHKYGRRGNWMRNRIKQINKYLILDVVGMIVYGLILYFGFALLAGLSLLCAYLWNFVLIILAISFDVYTEKMLKSVKTMMMLKKEYGTEKAYSMITGGFVSFKTLIYLFYLIILVISQIISFSPALFGENLVNFIAANNYSILFLLAFDTFIGQFSKDREKKKKHLEILKGHFAENDD